MPYFYKALDPRDERAPGFSRMWYPAGGDNLERKAQQCGLLTQMPQGVDVYDETGALIQKAPPAPAATAAKKGE